jgi:hypothetical protein
MSRLTRAEATEFLEAVLECQIDEVSGATVEAFAFDVSAHDAEVAVQSFLCTVSRHIDPESIVIREDGMDVPGGECCHIIIRTGELQ